MIAVNSVKKKNLAKITKSKTKLIAMSSRLPWKPSTGSTYRRIGQIRMSQLDKILKLSMLSCKWHKIIVQIK